MTCVNDLRLSALGLDARQPGNRQPVYRHRGAATGRDVACRVSTISQFHDLQFVEMCRQAPDIGRKMLPALTGVPSGTQYKKERTKINHILYPAVQNSGFS
jgi:hypothetical protein